MRILYGFVYIALFLAWVVYQAFAKRDLKRHMTDFYALTFFVDVWGFIFSIR